MSKSNRPAPRLSSLTGFSPIQPPTEPAQRSQPAAPAAKKSKTGPRPAATKPTTKAKAKAKAGTLTDTVRVGIYISAEDLNDARAAYLADWQTGSQADTFAKWISDVIDAHAARTAAERAELARPVVRAETRTADTRTFNVAADALERMGAAIVDDQNAGRWPSASAWCGDAVAAAVAQARDRSGGALPTPPARLPNRLRR